MTRYLVLSDIHANLPALNAVLEDAEQYGYDEAIHLGDLIGYGPFPNEVVELAESLIRHHIAGNHDRGAVGDEPMGNFNALAGNLLYWTGKTLKPGSLEFLKSLPAEMCIADTVLAVHGAPGEPNTYLLHPELVEVYASRIDPSISTVLFGHTHQAGIIFPEEGPIEKTNGSYIIDRLAFVNPGSVGQQRDFVYDMTKGTAFYAILDIGDGTFPKLEKHLVNFPLEELEEAYDRIARDINYLRGFTGIMLERIKQGY